ncbi:hypothetical protein THAOC_17974, partial [Thalassiosira oceanica]
MSQAQTLLQSQQRGRHLLAARRPVPQTQAERRTLSHLEALSVLISKKVREDRQARDEAAAADPFLTALDEREQKRQAREKRRREDAGQTDMFGSFATNAENAYDFFDVDPVTGAAYAAPLPNDGIKVLHEEGANHPLDWWGVEEPDRELVEANVRLARERGFA